MPTVTFTVDLTPAEFAGLMKQLAGAPEPATVPEPETEPEPKKRRGRPPKVKAEEPVADVPLPPPPAPEPLVEAAVDEIFDADLSKACNQAMQTFKSKGVPDGVVKIRALIGEFAGNDVRVSAIPQDKRAAFLKRLTQIV